MTQQDKAPQTDQRVRFLGLAFAGADLAFEVDQTGVIRFAIGAVEQITGIPQAGFVGAPWTSLISEADHQLLQSLLDSVGPGERQGPLRIGLTTRKPGGLARFASLSVFRLPQNADVLSCAVSLGAPAVQGEFARNAVGLLDPSTFDDAVAKAIAEATRAGHPVALALVQLQGLDRSISGLDAEAAQAARKKIGAALQLESYGVVGAAEIAPERFAFVRSTATPAKRIAERLQSACGDRVTAVAADLPLNDNPEQSLKAVRYALNKFVEAGPAESAMGFSAMLERTVRATARFKTSVASGAFNLVYQPVIDIARNQPHHFEALARFPGSTSPAETIELAEETGMIVDFDLAVAKAVVRVLTTEEKVWKIAINLSALSLMAPHFIDAFAKLTDRDHALRPRLLIEVTETQKLRDLPAANRAIARLRKLGHPICLDDFGAGSASLEYLSRLEIDFVKIDGRYVRNLKTEPRDFKVVKHIAALCQDLGVRVIAEMVETEDAAVAIKDLGIPLGQGWLYGKPADKPIWPPAVESAPPVRRTGPVVRWG